MPEIYRVMLMAFILTVLSSCPLVFVAFFDTQSFLTTWNILCLWAPVPLWFFIFLKVSFLCVYVCVFYLSNPLNMGSVSEQKWNVISFSLYHYCFHNRIGNFKSRLLNAFLCSRAPWPGILFTDTFSGEKHPGSVKPQDDFIGPEVFVFSLFYFHWQQEFSLLNFPLYLFLPTLSIWLFLPLFQKVFADRLWSKFFPLSVFLDTRTQAFYILRHVLQGYLQITSLE